MNRQTIIWQNAPSFYHIFSNRPLDEVLSEKQQASLRIGPEHIGLRAVEARLTNEEAKLWRGALTRNMTERGLWQLNEKNVSIIRGALFRAPVDLPANIVPGEYMRSACAKQPADCRGYNLYFSGQNGYWGDNLCFCT